MSRCSVIFPLLALLAAATGAAGQAQAGVAFSAIVPVYTSLQTQPGAATQVRAGDYTEVRQAVVLQVSANCHWRVVARRSGVSTPLWVRVHASDGVLAPSAPARLHSGMAVAEGERGRARQLVLDYRVPAGAAVGDVAFAVEEVESAPLLVASSAGR